MTRQPTGRLLRDHFGAIDLLLDRRFRAPIDDVWASVTESSRLERWIGRWEGEAGPGQTVGFVMTAEGSTEPEPVLIRECDAPRRLVVEFQQGEEPWRVSLSLTEADGVTTLIFGMAIAQGQDASDIGPGWEYYLDRLVADRAGEPLPDWEEYYPAQKSFYAEAMASIV